MKFLSLAFFCAALASAAAEPLPAPQLEAGDSWSYRLTSQKGGAIADSHIVVTVVRVGGDGVLVSQTSDASPGHVNSTMFGLDWSKRRSVNGQETVVVRPLAFPLELGKSWTLDYTEQNPTPQKLRQTNAIPYKVVGAEDVTTPAGRFHTLKIEAESRWVVDLAPRLVNNAVVARQGMAAATTSENRVVQGARVSGRNYQCFWYAPEVKRWVKSIEEFYASNGDLTERYVDELESFKLGGDAKPAAPDIAPKTSPKTPPKATPGASSPAAPQTGI